MYTVDYDIDLEFFAKSFLNGEERLELKRKVGKKELQLNVVSEKGTAKIEIEEKEALELASQIFRNVLGLY